MTSGGSALDANAMDQDRARDQEMQRDQACMAALQARDESALGELYDRHAPAMLGLACRLLGDRVDAEDLVHDVFVEAWRKAASFSAERGSVRAWLMVRVRSRAIDRLRNAAVARRHAVSESRAAADPIPHLSDDPAQCVEQKRARDALAALPAAQRTVIELAYFQGLSCADIAQRCDTPLGTVKSRLAAGLRDLRRVFETGGLLAPAGGASPASDDAHASAREGNG